MTYSLIGTGNMAWFLTERMLGAGHVCTGIYGRNAMAAAELAAAYHLPVYHRLEEINDGPDLCLLAVSDRAVAEISSLLRFRTTVLLHLAGALNLEVLSKGAQLYGVAWPVYSISKSNLPAHRQFPTVWEASHPEARSRVGGVAAALSDILYEAATAQRRWLHLTAVMSNNFMNHLLGICADICSEHGLPPSLLHPIVQQTISNAILRHPHDLQTGPARRGDEPTLKAQHRMLDQYPDAQAIYEVFTAAIKNRSGVKSGKD